MKNVVGFSAIALFSFIFLFESCSKSNVSPNPPPATTTPPVTVTTGVWTVTSVTQSTEDKTSMFNGYLFIFQPGGVLKADKNGVFTSGTWAFTTKAVTYYGAPPSKTSFTMNIGLSSPLSLLSKTWNVDSTHTNNSTLALVSPEVVENMHVTFSRQ